MMMSQHDWEKMCNIEPPLIMRYTPNATVMLPIEEYEKLKQDSETLARIKEYINNLDKE